LSKPASSAFLSTSSSCIIFLPPISCPIQPLSCVKSVDLLRRHPESIFRSTLFPLPLHQVYRTRLGVKLQISLSIFCHFHSCSLRNLISTVLVLSQKGIIPNQKFYTLGYFVKVQFHSHGF